MGKNKVLDIIIEFINANKSKQNITSEFNNKKYEICSCGYLLGQIIRELYLPKEHYVISKKANEVWNKLCSKDINEYYVGKNIKCDIAQDAELALFKGNSHQPYNKIIVHKNDAVLYNSVFHDEHIVTVSDIIKELLKLEFPTYENVSEILDKLYICKMLKEENIKIKNQRHRNSLDYKEIVKNDYNSVGIEIF